MEFSDSNENSQFPNMTLKDPKGFEGRLMKSVKDALRGIIDQQIKDNESNRYAYAELDRQIKQLAESVAQGSQGVHNASATVVLEVSPNHPMYHQNGKPIASNKQSSLGISSGGSNQGNG
jgi:hypothetical protein